METTEIPYGEKPDETATLLLAAAVELDLPPYVVRTTSKGKFVVPAEVAKKAGVGEPKKTAAKKAPAKKAASKSEDKE